MTTKADVPSWILTESEKTDLDDVFSAANSRSKTLSQIASQVNSAYLRIGTPVTLSGLSPKYLNDRTGHVTRINRGQRGKVTCSVELDHPIYQGRFYGQKTVNGIPTSCVKMHEGVS